MAELWHVQMSVNGQPVELDVTPFTTLVQVLRDHLGLRGAKVGCNEGECGSCTVIMDGRPVSSCLVLAPQAEGRDIWTIEGLAQDNQLHPMQDAFLREGAVQCGFCSPGFIMSGVALLNQHPDPTDDEIREGIEGNICRCTGYQKIVSAIRSCADATSKPETSR